MLRFNGVSSVNTSLSIKYNNILKALTLVCMKVYSSWRESHDKYSTLLCAIFATQLSPETVYFIQTGGSALSNTNC